MVNYKGKEYSTVEELLTSQLPGVLSYLANVEENASNGRSSNKFLNAALRKEYGPECNLKILTSVLEKDNAEYGGRKIRELLTEIKDRKNLNLAARLDPHIRKDIKNGNSGRNLTRLKCDCGRVKSFDRRKL